MKMKRRAVSPQLPSFSLPPSRVIMLTFVVDKTASSHYDDAAILRDWMLGAIGKIMHTLKSDER